MKKFNVLFIIIISLLFSRLIAWTIPISIETIISDQIVNLHSRAGDQNTPTIEINNNGSPVISWNSGDNIFVQRLDQNGDSIGDHFTVNDTSVQSRSRIGMAENRSFVIVWSGRQNDGFEDIYMQACDTIGNVVNSNVMVNIHRANNNSDYPDIAMMKNGNYVIVWQQDEDIYAKLFNAFGVAVSEIILVNDDTAYELQRRPVVDISENGSFTVAWYDRRDRTSDIMNYDIYAQRFDPAGNALGSNFKVNDEESSNYNQIDPSIAMDSTGNIIITWRDFRNDPSDIFAQRYDQNGNLIGTNFKVTDDGGTSGQIFPIVSMDNNGVCAVTWLDSRDGYINVYAQLYENDVRLGENFPIPDQSKINDVSRWSHPFISIQNSKIYTTWLEERNSSYGQDVYFNILEFSKLYVDTKEISNISTNSIYATGALYREDYLTQHGFCWNTEGNPSLEDDNMLLGRKDTIGLFSSTISELLPNTVYYLRAFTCNDTEDYKYGEVLSFRTHALPTIGDFTVIEEGTSLQLQANITDVGYPDPIQHGFCWNTTGNPTYSGSRVRLGSTNSAGIFSWTVQGLQNNEHYYFRAFVLNAAGTVYSDNTIEFTYIETKFHDTPYDFALNPNYPNPFNPKTAISYQLSADSRVELAIYNISGEKITTLVNEYKPAGYHRINWDASAFPSGVYFYHLTAGDFLDTKKMVLMK